MSQIKLTNFIKTDCGRAKLAELSSRSGVLASLRLVWFVIFAIIKDWNLPLTK